MENSKNKLWIFGDSFSFGSGCSPNDKYYIDYPEKRTNRGIFPEILSDKYNLELKNLSYPGRSCQHILEDVIHNIANFNEEDFIIIGLSDPVRIATWEELSTHNKEVERISINHYTCYTGTTEEDIQWRGSTRNMRKSTLDYITNTVMQFREYEEVNYFNLLVALEKTLNISKSFIWGATEWSTYETIFTDTNKQIEDYHFSWNGHKAFAKDIINRFKTEDRVVLYPHYYYQPKRVLI